MPIRSGWSRASIFNKAWQEELNRVTEAWMPAKIQVFFQELGDAVYNTDTGEFTYPTAEKIIYDGKARVQPIRMARNVSNNAADTIVQAVQFQVPDITLDNAVNYRVRVLECALNETLTSFHYTITDIVDSSNPIERTFVASVDTESKWE